MLITACADAGETDRAFKYLKWMEDDGLHDESLNMRVCIGLLQVCPTGPTNAIRTIPGPLMHCGVAGIARVVHGIEHGPISSVSAGPARSQPKRTGVCRRAPRLVTWRERRW